MTDESRKWALEGNLLTKLSTSRAPEHEPPVIVGGDHTLLGSPNADHNTLAKGLPKRLISAVVDE
jgi:hypothetical protein